MKRWLFCIVLLLTGCGQEKPAPAKVRLRCDAAPGPAGVFRLSRGFERMLDQVSMGIASGEVDRDVRVDFGPDVSLGRLAGALHHCAVAGFGREDGLIGFGIEGRQSAADFLLSVPLPEICCEAREDPQPICDDWGEALISRHSYYGHCIEYELTLSGGLWTSGTQGIEPGTIVECVAQRKALAPVALVTLVLDPMSPAATLVPVLEACRRTRTRFHIALAGEADENRRLVQHRRALHDSPALFLSRMTSPPGSKPGR